MPESGPRTKIMSQKYDDSGTGGYNYLEKLGMVAKGLMDPKEIGMASVDDAIFEITGTKPPLPFMGDWATFEVSVVPLDIQAKWARQELKVIPPNPVEWEAEWKEAHKNEFRVQGILKSGNCAAQVDQTFTDPILGFADMMRKAADMLMVRYNQVKEANPNPIKTREDLQNEARTAAVTGPKA